MLRRFAYFLILLSVVIVAPSTATMQRQVAPPMARTNIGFKLKAIDGKVYDTSATGGEVWVVSFGATWCTPCTWELVAIEELKEEYANKPVRFLWISIEDERRASNNILKQYAKERRLTIPVLRDSDGAVFAQFSTTTRIPLVAFFDREGNFVAPAHRGMSSEISEYKKLVRGRVDALLNAGQGVTTGGNAAN